VIGVAKTAGEYGGFFSIHIRDERNPDRFKWSVREAIEIGKKANLPVQISHLEAHYPNWGMQTEVLNIIEEARDSGVDVTCDSPAYLMATSYLSVTVPDWAKDGGFKKMLERLKDPGTRKKIMDYLIEEKFAAIEFFLSGNWDKVWLSESQINPEYSGKNMGEIAELRGVAPTFDIAFDLLIEEGRDMMVHAQLHNEDEIRKVIAHPLCMLESDAEVSVSTSGMENPRVFGSFPMIFRKYVRGEDREDEPLEKGKKILSLQEAVRKMTSFPAGRLGLKDRGMIREGAWADLVVFDPNSITDKATYTNSHQYAEGIDFVLVNGTAVVENGKPTNALPGRVLRHRV